MKVLVNERDKETEFSGDDEAFTDYQRRIDRYKEEMKNSDTLKELTDVLNCYSDFSNGSFEVKEY